MKRILLALLCLLLVFPAYAARYSDGYSASYALVVGINRYSLWPQLEYAARDAQEVAGLLAGQGFKVDVLLDERATKGNILRSLERLRRKAGPDARVAFYFAGHGQTEDMPSGGEQGYLVPVNADLYDWDATMLSMGEVNRLVRNFKAKHVFLAFDSCYSGLGLTRGLKTVKKNGEKGYIRKMLQLEAVQVLTAGGRSEQAMEANGHGLFTDHVLAALSGAADSNGDGYVTGTEVYAMVRPGVTQKSYGRQTPQFGYLQGEGDVVFKSAQKRRRGKATLVVASPFDGVDVWVDTEKVAANISSSGGRRLPVTAGRHRVLVKKGGRTLFCDTVFLPEDGKYRVDIPSNGTGPDRTAYSMYSIASKSIVNFSQSLPYDLDGDGREEIVTVADKQVLVYKANGKLWASRTFNYRISLDLAKEWQGRPVEWQGRPVIAVSGKDGNRVILALLDRELNTIWRHVRKITKVYQGKYDGGGKIAEIADIDNDGREEIIAFSTAGYAWKPRGVIVYDGRGHEMWRYLVGPGPTGLAVWKKRSGGADLIIGTYSPGNGNQERHNRTDDQHCYLVSVDAKGRTNWVVNVGTHFTGMKPLLVDLDGDGEDELYAYKWTAYDYRSDEGAIYRVARDGRILHRFEQRDSIKSLVAMTPFSGSGALYASDKNGTLLKLDQDLNVLRKRDMNRTTTPLIINLVGVHDYDGDNRSELLLYSFNRLQKGKNPRTDYGPRNKVFFSDMKYQVLSENLQDIERETFIAKEWDKWRGFKIVDFSRPEMSRYPFMVLSDKISLFNF